MDGGQRATYNSIRVTAEMRSVNNKKEKGNQTKREEKPEIQVMEVLTD